MGEVAPKVTERGFEEIEVAPKVTERGGDKCRVQNAECRVGERHGANFHIGRGRVYCGSVTLGF